MRKPLLFLPGPMQVPDQVRVAGDRPLFNHRSPQMSELLSKLEAGCKPLFGTTGDVLFLASSGTGAMESAIVNLTSPGDEIITIVGGTFSMRWGGIAKAYGLSVHAVEVGVPGDVLHIPAKVPHQMILAPGAKVTYFVTKVVE